MTGVFESRYRLRFQPWTTNGDSWSHAEVSVLSEFVDSELNDMRSVGTILEISGEHGDPAKIGTQFEFEMAEDPSAMHKGTSGIRRMLQSFRKSALPSERFRVEIDKKPISQES